VCELARYPNVFVKSRRFLNSTQSYHSAISTILEARRRRDYACRVLLGQRFFAPALSGSSYRQAVTMFTEGWISFPRRA
jgi:hypothetical protein